MAVEMPESPSTAPMGHHHVTIGVCDPQEDLIFIPRPWASNAVREHEPYETLGTELMMSPQIEANRDEVLAIIGTIEV